MLAFTRGERAGAFQHCHTGAKRIQSAPVQRNLVRSKLCLGALACLLSIRGQALEIAVPPPLEVVISVAEQRLVVLREGGLVAKYRISTSKFGLGDSFGSYKTPLGHLKVCDKVGDALVSGAVLKGRSATGEVLAVNAAGRDPIVTRILWLEGIDAENRNAKARGIYIHGTPEEKRLGQPVSWGCIRMRSQDVIEVFDHVPLGTSVNIIAAKLPKLRKYVPAPPVIIASAAPAVKTALTPAKPEATARLSPIAAGPTVIPADPGAAHSLKGSILSAGLPDAADKVGPHKQDSMKFQSWSSVSLRDPDAKGRTTVTR